jgi:hypothetical protein
MAILGFLLYLVYAASANAEQNTPLLFTNNRMISKVQLARWRFRCWKSALQRPAVPAILRPLFIRFPWQTRTRLDGRDFPGEAGFGWRRRASDCWDCWQSRRCSNRTRRDTAPISN